MEKLITSILGNMLLPPSSILILLLLALLLFPFRRKLAMFIGLVATVTLYGLSIPVISNALLSSLEIYQAIAPEDLIVENNVAIVVLGGDRYPEAPEYSGDTVSEPTLARLQYAARLQRHTGAPILLTGGSPYNEKIPEATLMKQVLSDSFGITDAWVETRSSNTAENAFFSQEILKSKNINKIYLVTHAWHMRRAVTMFRKAGVDVIPTPTRFSNENERAYPAILQWIPKASALKDSSTALREMMATSWYQIRY